MEHRGAAVLSAKHGCSVMMVDGGKRLDKDLLSLTEFFS